MSVVQNTLKNNHGVAENSVKDEIKGKYLMFVSYAEEVQKLIYPGCCSVLDSYADDKSFHKPAMPLYFISNGCPYDY